MDNNNGASDDDSEQRRSIVDTQQGNDGGSNASCRNENSLTTTTTGGTTTTASADEEETDTTITLKNDSHQREESTVIGITTQQEQAEGLDVVAPSSAALTQQEEANKVNVDTQVEESVEQDTTRSMDATAIENESTNTTTVRNREDRADSGTENQAFPPSATGQVAPQQHDNNQQQQQQQQQDAKEDERRARLGGKMPSVPVNAVAITETRPQSSSSILVATVLPLSQTSSSDNHEEQLNHDKDSERRQNQRDSSSSSATRTVPGAVSYTTAVENNNRVAAPAVAHGTSETERNLPGTISASNIQLQSQTTLPPPRENLVERNHHAEESMVTATPIEAVIIAEAIQVTIDEETGDDNHYNTAAVVANEELRNKNGEISYRGSSSVSGGRIRRIVFAILLAVGIVLAVALPLSLSKDDGSDGEPPLPDPGPPQTFDYPCYTSTLQILLDQLQEANETANDTFILCPNTTIQVGTLVNHPEVNLEYFDKGDYPIWIVRPGITVQCGLDGKSENNCTLDGGFLQVVAMPTLLLPAEYTELVQKEEEENDDIVFLENITIRGIAFTGPIQRAGNSLGTSVSMSQSGTFTFEDCHWIDMTNSGTTITVYRNDFASLPFVPMPQNSIHVNVVDSSFTNIYFGSPLVAVTSQSLTMEHCIFDELKPSNFATTTCDLILGSRDVIRTDGGCVGLVYCGDHAVCDMSNCCLMRSTITGPGIVYFVHNTTSGNVTNNYFDADTVDIGNVDCALALGKEKWYDTRFDAMGNFDCDDEAFQEADSCSLFF